MLPDKRTIGALSRSAQRSAAKEGTMYIMELSYKDSDCLSDFVFDQKNRVS
jgi:hypothetical protein